MINKNVFTDTKNRLIRTNIIVVGSFLFLFSIFIYFYFRGLTYNSIDTKINNELNNVVVQLERSSFFNPLLIDDPKDMVYVYQKGRLRYYTQNRYFQEIIPDMNKYKKNDFFTYSKNGYTFRELNIIVGEYDIQIIRNIDSEMSSLKQLIFVLIIASIVSIIITYFIAIYLTRKSLLQIEGAWNNQAKFVQDASHELRTPIAIISSKLEKTLKSPENTINDEVENIADAMKETRRLKKMINDLLALTKEDAITELNIETINIEEFIKEICTDYTDIAEAQEKLFEFNSYLKNNLIKTDKNKLRQLMLIFIDNAFKYTNYCDSIIVELKDFEDDINIIISDTGMGIKDSEQPYIFDRFFRSENVRNKNFEGSGIGLSIAKMISLNLGLKIKVESQEEKGTKFEIIVPKKV